MSILVVDDVAIMRTVIKDILIKFCDYSEDDIHEADGGEDAISKYEKLKPKFVFLDITMPDLDGITVVEEIMSMDSDAYIVMCTSSNEETDVKECIISGAKDYIVKPPVPERIKGAIDKFKALQ